MNIERFVVDLIVKKCGGITHKEIDSTSLLSSLPLGSLKMLEIVHEIEVQFGIDIDENQLFDIKTVGDVVSLVPAFETE